MADPEQSISPHAVGKLDLYQILGAGSCSSEEETIRSIERVLVTVSNLFQHPGAQRSFTGFLLSGWHDIPTVVLDALARSLGDLGLDLYLEILPPHFLDGPSKPDLQFYAGVLVKNGTTLPNGEVRDYFQMERMRSTTKSFVSQSCLRPFTVMVWDTVDDRIEVSHAVVKRAYGWCGYHGAIVWVGPEAAATNAEANQPILEPLAAFHWLKEQKVMAIHAKFRSSRKVCTSIDLIACKHG